MVATATDALAQVLLHAWVASNASFQVWEPVSGRKLDQFPHAIMLDMVSRIVMNAGAALVAN